MSEEKTPVTPAKKGKKTTPITPAVETPTPPGNETLDKSVLGTGAHLGNSFVPHPTDVTQPEPPQIINGVVVPRANVTGIKRRLEDSRPVGRQTSRIVDEPSVAVRFSHEGLRAMVVRIFEDVKLAMEFVNNPNNAHGNPQYVDPKTVHPEELQQNVNVFRQRQNVPKKKQRIDAPVGAKDGFETGIYQPDGSAQITDPEDPATLV